MTRLEALEIARVAIGRQIDHEHAGLSLALMNQRADLASDFCALIIKLYEAQALILKEAQT